jgi:PAS domain S-box-containing protein
MDITERKRAEESATCLNLELEERIAERTADLARINAALQVEIEERKCAEQDLMRNKRSLRLAIDTIPGLVWSSLPDGNVEYLNQRWLDYTGLTLEEASGWGWQQAIHPDDLPGLVTYWTSIVIAGVAGEYEARLRRFDGEFRWFLFRGVPLFDEQGKLVKWYGTNTDVEALRSSEHLARGQLDALTHTLASLAQETDPDNLPRHVVNTILSQLGADSVTVWERNGDALDLLGVVEAGHFQTGREAGYFEGRIPAVGHAPPLWIEALQTGMHTVIEDIDKEPSRILLGDGRSATWAAADLTPPFANLKLHLGAQGVRGLLISPMMMGDRLAGIIGIRFTGTRNFRCEEIELSRALAHQAMLAIRLMRLSEQSRRAAVAAERNRMARDIHDTLAQGFTGVVVQLEAAEEALSQNLLGKVGDYVGRAGELARESLREARRSVQALRPQALEEKDLCAALQDLIEKMTAGTALRAEFAAEGERRELPAEWEENLLRIGQEALTNAIRHAQATELKMHLVFDHREIRLSLRDNGRGFDPTGRHEGFGLQGMRERVESMGGHFSIQSAKDSGTAISIVLPLAIASESAAS